MPRLRSQQRLRGQRARGPVLLGWCQRLHDLRDDRGQRGGHRRGHRGARERRRAAFAWDHCVVVACRLRWAREFPEFVHGHEEEAGGLHGRGREHQYERTCLKEEVRAHIEEIVNESYPADISVCIEEGRSVEQKCDTVGKLLN